MGLAKMGKKDSQHHDGSGSFRTNGRFRNPWRVREPGFADLLKWVWERRWKDLPNDDVELPLANTDPAFLQANRNETTLTWIGHATVLLQLAGCNILTDPVFSQRVFPVQWAGPQRLVPPGIALDELPAIDLVLLSHDHYDALDTGSIRRLYARPGGERTAFLTPLGYRRWFDRHGIGGLQEFDWWEPRQVAGLTVTAVPVRHWGKRGIFDRNRRLWAGWVVQAGDFRFFFAGDSGYDAPLFAQIGERCGPFDLAAIPIGAYAPRWFMRAHHLAPEESVLVHRAIGARRSAAIHWGTFILTDEPLLEPPRRLATALQEHRIPPEDFRVLRHGETWRLDTPA